MTSPRRICAVTGSRADYGLLRWTLQEIADDPELALQLAVTGAHLDPTADSLGEIQADGFAIDAEVDMLLSNDSPRGVAKSLGLGVIGFADALDRLQPDLLLILGDRYEILAAAQAAMLARIPIAHIHGGESTEGAIDEAIRHAVTKLSHIHCVAAETYRRRVIQLGEPPERVHVVGATGLDAIERLKLLERHELEKNLGYPLDERHLLVTHHPVTLEDEDADAALQPLIEALSRFPDATVTITGANADPLGRRFNEILHDYASRQPQVHFVQHLGQLRYLSLARLSGAVIGNSSSGLIEIPALGVPTVNIGDRQRNRLRAPSVIDCTNEANAIAQAIDQALTPTFQQLAQRRETPYGTPGAARRIHHRLKGIELEQIIRKRFHDLPEAIP